MRAVDVHGFGGGFTLGAVRAGFTLASKKSREIGFGVLNCLANRDLLGHEWDADTTIPEKWEPLEDVQLVFGNPPCSGFSTLSRKDFRGVNSTINECMWELVRYAARVAPEIVIFESVQQAFTQGKPLMRNLHQMLCEQTGKPYRLYHVLHNNASLGGCSIRRRYFWVASRIPFGVDDNTTYWSNALQRLIPDTLSYVPAFNDVLQDLEPLGLTMLSQPYRGTVTNHSRRCDNEWHNLPDRDCTCPVVVLHSSPWARRHAHDASGRVDGHDIARSPTYDRIAELFAEGMDWHEGERIGDVLRRYYRLYGKLPRGWYYNTKKPMLNDYGSPVLDDSGKPTTVDIVKADRLIETDFAMGHNQTVRWRGGRMAKVITGGAVHLILHPTLNRTLTQREAARIQGFPDNWKIWPVRNAADLGPAWGKGVPVQAGQWIADWAYSSLAGNPGPMAGDPFGDGGEERIINVTDRYKQFARMIGDPS
jgi:site-specific DNA-cytosine methylase